MNKKNVCVGLVILAVLLSALEDNGWQIEYSTQPGKHNQDYWLSRLPEYLNFYTGTAR